MLNPAELSSECTDKLEDWCCSVCAPASWDWLSKLKFFFACSLGWATYCIMHKHCSCPYSQGAPLVLHWMATAGLVKMSRRSSLMKCNRSQTPCNEKINDIMDPLMGKYI